MSVMKTIAKIMKMDRRTLFVSLVQRMSNSKISHIIPDKPYLSLQYRVYIGKRMNWKNPSSFTEKIQWLKLYNRNQEHCILVDKYEVKKYITEQLGREYIIPTLGVWDKFEDIDFTSLPNQFVLKCTHDSGSVVICRSKECFDVEKAKEKINRKMKNNLFWHGREWPYKHLKPRIIAEQYMEDEITPELTDYKFYCFNGEPQFLYVSKGLENHATAAISFLTLDWQFAPYERSDFKPFAELPPEPCKFDEMVEIARKLSAGHPFLRVDLYEINGHVYFSELTFSPGAGFTKFRQPEHDVEIGNMLVLPNE